MTVNGAVQVSKAIVGSNLFEQNLVQQLYCANEFAPTPLTYWHWSEGYLLIPLILVFSSERRDFLNK